MSEKATNPNTPRIPVRQLDGGGHFLHIKPATFDSLDKNVQAAIIALGETARSTQVEHTASKKPLSGLASVLGVKDAYKLIEEMRADEQYLREEIQEFGPSEVDPDSFRIGEFGPKNFPDGHPLEFDET